LARGVDAGFAHVWDLRSGDTLATFWGDVRIQLTNRNNLLKEPTFAIELRKGFNDGAGQSLHITSLSGILSADASRWVTPFGVARAELISGDFIPENADLDRYTFAAGTEIRLRPREPGRLIPRLTLSVGTVSAVTGGNGSRKTLFGVGIGLDGASGTAR
jgi:hypothetical protein